MPVRVLKASAVPKSLAGPIALSLTGAPRYWSEVYVALAMGSNARGTVRKRIQSIEALYRFCDEAFGPLDLDRTLATAAIDHLHEILQSYLVRLNNQSAITEIDRSNYWNHACLFIRTILEHRGSDSLTEAQRMTAALSELQHKYASLRPARRRKVILPRSLRSDVVAELNEIFEPDSPRNPFRGAANRYRNNLIYLMLLHLGIRIGEALSLPIKTVLSDSHPRTGKTVHWLNIQDNLYPDFDSRYEEPSLKTASSNRQLPIAPTFARLIGAYVEGYRTRGDHPFLFGSEHGAPLSPQSARYIFKVAHGQLSDRAKSMMETFNGKELSSHDLRHTCAVHKLRQLKQRYDHDDALRRMRRWFGWSKNSTMPNRYASAYLEEESDTAARNDFDEFVSAIRSVDPREDIL